MAQVEVLEQLGGHQLVEGVGVRAGIEPEELQRRGDAGHLGAADQALGGGVFHRNAPCAVRRLVGADQVHQPREQAEHAGGDRHA